MLWRPGSAAASSRCSADPVLIGQALGSARRSSGARRMGSGNGVGTGSGTERHLRSTLTPRTNELNVSAM